MTFATPLSSNLLSLVVRRLLEMPTDTQHVAEQAGALFIAFLSEIRHPGAFLSIFPHYSEVVACISSSRTPSDKVK